MFFRKKAYFYEIVFTNEFYIDGVDVFNNNHRIEMKKIDIKLPFNVSYSCLNESTLYKILGMSSNFSIAISNVRDFCIISFITSKDFLKAHKNRDITINSNERNLELKLAVVASILSKDLENNNNYYSENYRRKAVIEKIQESFKVTYYGLLIEDEYDFHFRENINKSNFYGWQDEGTASYYDNYENALKNVKLNLCDFSKVRDSHGYQINL